MKTSKYLSIGSISHGTMRPEDLRDAIYWECKYLRMSREDRREVNAMMRASDEDLPDYVDSMFDVLNDYCPVYCYFGATEGDGSDYGCWPCIDQIEEDLEEGAIVRYNDMPKGYTGTAVDISDHGNVTLYHVTRGRAREVWCIV